MQYIPCTSTLLAPETLFLTLFFRNKIAYAQALNFRLSPNFSAGATRAPVQLLPPCEQK